MRSSSRIGHAFRHPLETARFLAFRDRPRWEALRLVESPHRQPLEDFAAYRGLSLMDAAMLARRGAERVAEHWSEHEPQTPEEIEEWHRGADAWLAGLVAWNMQPGYLDLLDRLAPERGGVCLIFGGGIGGEAMPLSAAGNEIWFCELRDTPMWDFAAWRAEKHGYAWRFVSEVPKQEAVFDFIVAFNSLGSLPPGTLGETAVRMSRALKPGGTLYASHDWDERPGHPYIHDHTKLWERTVAELPLEVKFDSREPGSDSRVYFSELVKHP
jgi:hypothetical protein